MFQEAFLLVETERFEHRKVATNTAYFNVWGFFLVDV